MDAKSFEKSESGAESHYSNLGPCSQLRRARAKHVCFAFGAAGVLRRSGLEKKQRFFCLKVNQTAEPPNATIL